MTTRSKPSLHPGLCPRCHGAGVEEARPFTVVGPSCPQCHGVGVCA